MPYGSHADQHRPPSRHKSVRKLALYINMPEPNFKRHFFRKSGSSKYITSKVIIRTISTLSKPWL